MHNIINRNKKPILITSDVLSITLSFIFALLLRFDFTIPPYYLNQLKILLPVFITIQVLVFNLSGFYNVIWRFTSFWDMVNLAKGILVSNLMSFFIFDLVRASSDYSRSVLLMFFILNILMISLTRVLVRLYHTHYKNITAKSNNNKKKLILIGAGKTADKIIREIKNHSNSPFNIIGIVDDDLSLRNATIHGVKVLGRVFELPNLENLFDEILITAPSATGNQVREIVKICKLTGKKYRIIPSLLELIDKNVSIADIRNVSYSDLLGRKEIKLDMNSLEKTIKSKRILITGAGGSIGSELVRQCLIFKPLEIVCLDNSEENIFNLEQELTEKSGETFLKYQLCTINNKEELRVPFLDTRPQIVFHAAAYKHVPIQETHPWSAVKTNVGGTLNLVEYADQYNVELFVLVSTDKAVNPVNVMGATKRIAEKIIQSYNERSKTSFMAVRFGNVLGSSGSAIPIFEKQISMGGPVTITHPEMKRYFMSIQEASQLILQCAALGKDGEIFLLDMGKPIKIVQMVNDLIRLSGFEPDEDIPIVFSGLRPGEKLYEELQLKNENKINTQHKQIMVLENKYSIDLWDVLNIEIKLLLEAGLKMNPSKIKNSLENLIPSYQPRTLSTKHYKKKKEIKVQA